MFCEPVTTHWIHLFLTSWIFPCLSCATRLRPLWGNPPATIREVPVVPTLRGHAQRTSLHSAQVRMGLWSGCSRAPPGASAGFPPNSWPDCSPKSTLVTCSSSNRPLFSVFLSPLLVIPVTSRSALPVLEAMSDLSAPGSPSSSPSQSRHRHRDTSLTDVLHSALNWNYFVLVTALWPICGLPEAWLFRFTWAARMNWTTHSKDICWTGLSCVDFESDIIITCFKKETPCSVGFYRVVLKNKNPKTKQNKTCTLE